MSALSATGFARLPDYLPSRDCILHRLAGLLLERIFSPAAVCARGSQPARLALKANAAASAVPPPP